MSLIESVKTYLAGYAGLEENAPLWVDHLHSEVTAYAIIPLPGAKIVAHYINGGSLREFPFSFRSTKLTADEQERLDNNGFFEALAAWFESQSSAGKFPTLGAGKKPIRIQAVSWAFLYEQGESDTAVYDIQCKLTYEHNLIS